VRPGDTRISTKFGYHPFIREARLEGVDFQTTWDTIVEATVGSTKEARLKANSPTLFILGNLGCHWKDSNH
jgi:hypothetical protein